MSKPTNENKVFAGLRRNSHGDGKLALPGGHLEMYETWEEVRLRVCWFSYFHLIQICKIYHLLTEHIILLIHLNMLPICMCQCAVREVLEETGLCIHNVQFGHVTNDIMKDQGKHYVTIFMMAECVGEK